MALSIEIESELMQTFVRKLAFYGGEIKIKDTKGVTRYKSQRIALIFENNIALHSVSFSCIKENLNKIIAIALTSTGQSIVGNRNYPL